jgi:hypothetical protein
MDDGYSGVTPASAAQWTLGGVTGEVPLADAFRLSSPLLRKRRFAGLIKKVLLISNSESQPFP